MVQDYLHCQTRIKLQEGKRDRELEADQSSDEESSSGEDKDPTPPVPVLEGSPRLKIFALHSQCSTHAPFYVHLPPSTDLRVIPETRIIEENEHITISVRYPINMSHRPLSQEATNTK